MAKAERAPLSLRQLNVEIGEAERRHDIEFLDEVLHKDLVFRRSDGSIVGKQEYLQAVPSRSYAAVESVITELEEGESAGLTTVLVRAEGSGEQGSFAGTFRNTRLFLRERESWRCKVWINSRIGLNTESVHHVSLPVRDLEASRSFYRELLGMHETERPPFDFPGAWYQVGLTQLHLIKHDGATFRGDKGVDSHDIHCAFRVGSYREAREFLRARGYREEGDESDAMKMKVSPRSTAGFPQIHLLDPDGHVIEINAEKLDE